MDGKGNGWGDAPTESSFNGQKTERVRGARYPTHDAARASRACRRWSTSVP
jgi:hypothetical protein